MVLPEVVPSSQSPSVMIERVGASLEHDDAFEACQANPICYGFRKFMRSLPRTVAINAERRFHGR
jgi:hypothetical protein